MTTGDTVSLVPTANGPASLRAARRYCRRLATTHYENFNVVSWLLPRHLHQHFYNVYAYCRWADDLADEVTDHNGRYSPTARDRSLHLLAWWREQLLALYEGSEGQTPHTTNRQDNTDSPIRRLGTQPPPPPSWGRAGVGGPPAHRFADPPTRRLAIP